MSLFLIRDDTRNFYNALYISTFLINITFYVTSHTVYQQIKIVFII